MGRITTRRPVTKITLGGDPVRRSDTLAVEEPLEIRVGGTSLAITMRTPGNDVELAAGFLVSEGVISAGEHFRGAIHCGGPGTGGPLAGNTENTYNVLDVTLGAGVAPPDPDLARNFYTTSSCGICGKASIEAVETVSVYDVAADAVALSAELLATFPDKLRAQQAVFDKTGGLHAAALFDATTGELVVLREDVGRHNAVDKVVGWALERGALPLSGHLLAVSGRISFEIAQKALAARIPIVAAVSAPTSLAVALAERAGLALIGFAREGRGNVYGRRERVEPERR